MDSCRLLRRLLALNDRLLACLCDEPRVYFAIQFGEQSGPVAKTPHFFGPKPRTRRSVMLQAKLSATQFLILTPVFQDAKGNPAKVDGAPTYACDNSDVLALVQGTLNADGTFVEVADGISCKVLAIGPMTPTPVTVTMNADADLGSGVEPLIGTAEITVDAGKATKVELQASTPQEQT